MSLMVASNEARRCRYKQNRKYRRVMLIEKAMGRKEAEKERRQSASIVSLFLCNSILIYI
jgi:hypothetical protein